MPLLKGGIKTVVRVAELLIIDSNKEQSICLAVAFFKSENIAIIGLLMNFHTESATVTLLEKSFSHYYLK